MGEGRSLPDAFRAPRLLRWLNILAVGASLAACTGVVFTLAGAQCSSTCAATTLLFGLVWARTVRFRIGRFPAG